MAEDVFGIVGSLQAAVFRVERVVAEGGFGVVYRAYHEGFRAAVALKCLKIPGAFSAEQRQEFLKKFQEEGETLFRLSALLPSVVRPLHVGTLETSKHPFVPFIALEWLDGESLDAVIERRRAAGKPPLDLARVVRMMGPVARALECAHKFPGPGGAQLSILHRDLKPENLFLAKVHGQETLKILDFGIGKVRSAATQMVGRVSAEQGGLAAFTPAYGAPEQWLPKRYGQTGPWTDIWGFALCAVEALTNRAPFEGDAPAVMGACINEQERPTPLTFGVRLPERAEAAFKKALAVDPVQRFHDMGAFWDELEAVVGHSTPRIAASPSFSNDSLPHRSRHRRLNPWLRAGAATRTTTTSMTCTSRSCAVMPTTSCAAQMHLSGAAHRALSSRPRRALPAEPMFARCRASGPPSTLSSLA
jgi:serine/threonine-protein kinase